MEPSKEISIFRISTNGFHHHFGHTVSRFLSSRLQKNRCTGAPKSWCTGAPETDTAVSAITFFQKHIFNYFFVMHLGLELCEHWSTLNGVCCEDCRQWLCFYHYLRHCMSHNNMRIGDYSLPCNISALRACWHPNHYMLADLSGVEVDDPGILWWFSRNFLVFAKLKLSSPDF